MFDSFIKLDTTVYILKCLETVLHFVLNKGLLVGCGKKVIFCGIFRGKFREKMADFAGNVRKFSGPISLKKPLVEMTDFVEIFWAHLLKSDQFCTDLTSIFNKKDGHFQFFLENDDC